MFRSDSEIGKLCPTIKLLLLKTNHIEINNQRSFRFEIDNN